MATTYDQTEIESLVELQALKQSDLIAEIIRGLPAELARELAARMEITLEEVASLLRLTPRTLQRRLEEGRLELMESERLWELSRLVFRAVEVLEAEEAARHWLKSPIQALGWKKPMELAQTTVGVRELEHILGRIEHGVFS